MSIHQEPTELASVTGSADSSCCPCCAWAGGPRDDLHTGDSLVTRGPGVGGTHLESCSWARAQCLSQPAEGSRAPAAGIVGGADCRGPGSGLFVPRPSTRMSPPTPSLSPGPCWGLPLAGMAFAPAVAAPPPHCLLWFRGCRGATRPGGRGAVPVCSVVGCPFPPSRRVAWSAGRWQGCLALGTPAPTFLGKRQNKPLCAGPAGGGVPPAPDLLRCVCAHVFSVLQRRGRGSECSGTSP